MKNLIFKFLLFLTIPLIIILTTFLYKKNKTNSRLKEISEIYSVLIMGDSHMQGFNPALFKEKTYNFANWGEHYFYTYSKLSFITANKQNKVKFVILGVSPHNFGSSFKRCYDFNCIEGKKSLQRFLYFINLFNSKGHSFFDFLNCSFFYRGIFSSPDWGGYWENLHTYPALLTNEGINKTIDTHYKYNNAIDSSFQEFYLSKIIKTCNDSGIKVIAVSTPVYKEYYKRIPGKFLDLNLEVLKKYQNKLTYINYLSFQMPDSYFADGDHLNVFGSRIITMKIDSIINVVN